MDICFIRKCSYSAVPEGDFLICEVRRREWQLNGE
jgi:hypothetical protein